jgi:hypothetical protein
VFECGVCNGDGIAEGACDCDGNIEDACGECDGLATGPGTGDMDCNGDCFGEAYEDGCGDCVGGETDEEPCKPDCAGNLGGNAFYDECNVCNGWYTDGVKPGYPYGECDCNGGHIHGADGDPNTGDEYAYDNCDFCTLNVLENGSSPSCLEDCAGIVGGTSTINMEYCGCTTNNTRTIFKTTRRATIF